MSLSNNFPDIQPSLNLSFALTKKLDPRITFTRTTTGVFYDGKTTAKAEENLLLRSQEFDNASWLRLNVSVTADNATAPDGTNTADTIVENAATGVHEIYSFATVNGVTYTISVFAKRNSGTRNLTFRGAGQGGAGVHPIFDLGSGTVAQNGTGTWSNQTITLVAGGWYRCSATVVASAVANIFIGMADGTSQSYTGDDTSSIDLWGAQLEQRSAVTAYTPTTTQPITNYIPVLQTAASGVARFDHNPTTGESLGLLVEEQRTNLQTYSAEFDNAAWTKTSATVTANTIVAPDGTLTGEKVIADNSTASFGMQLYQQAVVSASTAYTMIAYLKAAEVTTNRMSFIIRDASNVYIGEVGYTFDFSAGTTTFASTGGTPPTNHSSTISPVGNGWYRCSITATTTSGTGKLNPVFARNTATGDGYSGIYIWGAQLEAGAFPTSYIATTSASVTRNADAASMTGTNFSSWFNNAEGTFYSEAAPLVSDYGLNKNLFLATDNTSSNFVGIRYASSGSQQTASCTVNGTLQSNITLGTLTAGTYYKVVSAYKVNDFAGSRDAGSVSTDTSGTIPVVSQAEIGSLAGSNIASQHIKKLAFYPSRLSNAQLQALTS